MALSRHQIETVLAGGGIPDPRKVDVKLHTLDEIKAMRAALGSAVKSLVDEFETETKVYVTEIYLDRDKGHDGERPGLSAVKIGLCI